MRVNIYEHEVTLDVKLVTKDERDAMGKFVRHMYGLQFVVGGQPVDAESGETMVKSAVTFWSSERYLAGDFAARLTALQDGLGNRS